METCVTPLFDPDRRPFTLPPADGWPEQRHQFDEQCVWAVQAAFATGRPLLVRGEPGTGKSQLARAVAYSLKRPFLYEVINAKTDVTDLLFYFDAVARLGEAQIQSACAGRAGVTEEAVREILKPEKFISPGKIWWAINWESASKQAELSRAPKPDAPAGAWCEGCVLLIDEIDKADSELPNAMLECFANQSFHVQYLSTAVTRHSGQKPPLVVITTNEERELPAAFLRRCLVLHLQLAKNDDALKAFLIRRGNVHFEELYKQKTADYETVLENAAALLIADRNQMEHGGLSKPGQAEYLDLCKAVFEIAAIKKIGGMDVLKDVANFALKKNPV